MKANRFYAIHADHLNTPRLITDDTNKVVWQWAYSAFGDNKPTGLLKATPNPKAALTNVPTLLKATVPMEVNLRYPGQHFDEESNFNYNLMRSYDAGSGRYTQSDPIGLGGGWNRFGYANQNPLTFADPLGLDPWGRENPDPWYPGASKPPFQCRPDGQPWGWGCGDKDTDHRVPDVVGGVNLIPACRKHDDCYDNASRPGAAKSQCDQQFKTDIYAVCRQAGKGDYYCKGLSSSYFKGVDIGGGNAWNAAKGARP